MSENLIGKTLLNQFRVDAFIAAGGMGSVYRVWDLQRNIPLAMKILHSDTDDDPSALRVFQREASALQQLAHPNIVPFYGLYQAEGLYFMLESYIDGITLKDLLARRPNKLLSIEEAMVCLKAISAALDFAHSNGVVHCDVKPGNIMVDQSGTLYLTDFGIARHAESTSTTIAAAGAPAYMAPEQIRKQAVTPATDIYGLGVTLFEMLTGQRPFRGSEPGTETGGDTAAERIRYAQQFLPPPDPRALNPLIPLPLSWVIVKALAKNPSDRYLDMQAFFEAACQSGGLSPQVVPDRWPRLEEVGQSVNMSAGQTPAVMPVQSTVRLEGQGQTPVAAAPRSRLPVLVTGILVGLICLVTVAAVSYLWWNDRQNRNHQADLQNTADAMAALVFTATTESEQAAATPLVEAWTPTPPPVAPTETPLPAAISTPTPPPALTDTPVPVIVSAPGVPQITHLSMFGCSGNTGSFRIWWLPVENAESYQLCVKIGLNAKATHCDYGGPIDNVEADNPNYPGNLSLKLNLPCYTDYLVSVKAANASGESKWAPDFQYKSTGKSKPTRTPTPFVKP